MKTQEKLNRLTRILQDLKRVVVAFSGGVDSTYLAFAACKDLGKNSLAVTVDSSFISRSEITEATELARILGLHHRIVSIGSMSEQVLSNPPDRCYHCKKVIFSLIRETARAENIDHVLDGSNADDTRDYRPGMKAISEMGIRSPLLEAGLTKADIRELSRLEGLPTWDKPAAACLASRIPYHQFITPDTLGRIEKAENFLKGKGLRQVRVRSHGELARIEVDPEERSFFFDTNLMDEIACYMKVIGFQYSSLDVEGYRTGKLNRAIGQNKPEQ